MTRPGAAKVTALATPRAPSGGTLAIVFRVQDARYAMPCKNIVEVIPLVALRAVPQGPRCLLGVFAYRGQLTPVIDLCALIGGYDCPKRLSSRIVLVRCTRSDGSASVVGFLAEHVTEARRIAGEALPAAALAGADYVAETLLDDGDLLQIIDENAVLSRFDGSAALALPAQESKP